MGRTSTVEAIVLKTHDVGEADRFCILFTKERGKLAARARSVRKPGSKMGGSVLPMSHVSLQLTEGSAGFMITDAKRISDAADHAIGSFLNAQQGMELLISTLQDEEPLPELFDTTLHFLHTCATSSTHTVLPFTLSLLNVMGLLPEIDEPYFDRFSDNQKQFVKKSVEGAWAHLPDLDKRERMQFSETCAVLISELTSAPLKAGSIIAEMRD